jgi:hypothetical protein
MAAPLEKRWTGGDRLRELVDRLGRAEALRVLAAENEAARFQSGLTRQAAADPDAAMGRPARPSVAPMPGSESRPAPGGPRTARDSAAGAALDDAMGLDAMRRAYEQAVASAPGGTVGAPERMDTESLKAALAQLGEAPRMREPGKAEKWTTLLADSFFAGTGRSPQSDRWDRFSEQRYGKDRQALEDERYAADRQRQAIMDAMKVDAFGQSMEAGGLQLDEARRRAQEEARRSTPLQGIAGLTVGGFEDARASGLGGMVQRESDPFASAMASQGLEGARLGNQGRRLGMERDRAEIDFMGVRKRALEAEAAGGGGGLDPEARNRIQQRTHEIAQMLAAAAATDKSLTAKDMLQIRQVAFQRALEEATGRSSGGAVTAEQLAELSHMLGVSDGVPR